MADQRRRQQRQPHPIAGAWLPGAGPASLGALGRVQQRDPRIMLGPRKKPGRDRLARGHGGPGQAVPTHDDGDVRDTFSLDLGAEAEFDFDPLVGEPSTAGRQADQPRHAGQQASRDDAPAPACRSRTAVAAWRGSGHGGRAHWSRRKGAPGDDGGRKDQGKQVLGGHVAWTLVPQPDAHGNGGAIRRVVPDAKS